MRFQIFGEGAVEFRSSTFKENMIEGRSPEATCGGVGVIRGNAVASVPP